MLLICGICEQIISQIRTTIKLISRWAAPLLRTFSHGFRNLLCLFFFLSQKASQQIIPKRHRKYCYDSSSFLAVNSEKTPFILHQSTSHCCGKSWLSFSATKSSRVVLITKTPMLSCRRPQRKALKVKEHMLCSFQSFDKHWMNSNEKTL